MNTVKENSITIGSKFHLLRNPSVVAEVIFIAPKTNEDGLRSFFCDLGDGEYTTLKETFKAFKRELDEDLIDEDDHYWISISTS